jgi:hypothetical protein
VAVDRVVDRHAVGTSLGLQLEPEGADDLKQVEKGGGGQESVLGDTRPGSVGCHVVEPREALDEVGWIHGRTVLADRGRHQRRRSMTLRTAKRVTMSDTGTPATFSTSSMNRKVSSLSWSKRRASWLATSM